jgi:hypothetical protein
MASVPPHLDFRLGHLEIATSKVRFPTPSDGKGHTLKMVLTLRLLRLAGNIFANQQNPATIGLFKTGQDKSSVVFCSRWPQERKNSLLMEGNIVCG